MTPMPAPEPRLNARSIPEAQWRALAKNIQLFSEAKANKGFGLSNNQISRESAVERASARASDATAA